MVNQLALCFILVKISHALEQLLSSIHAAGLAEDLVHSSVIKKK